MVFKFITLSCLVMLAQGQLNFDNPRFIPDYIQTQSAISPVQQLPLQDSPSDFSILSISPVQQLPSEDAPADFSTVSLQYEPPQPQAPRPFYLEQPSTELKAPTKDAQIFSYDLDAYPPEPASELQLPSLEKWNPQNDPKLYYPIQTDLPTSLYPKKFNKEPKSQLPLKNKASLTDADLALKQRQIDKVLFMLAKQENKKRLMKEEEERKRMATEESQEEVVTSAKDQVKDALTAATNGFHSGISPHAVSGNALNYGLSHDGERMDFHVHGHDGPYSYKWGFDTGKGYNRHFRYEERNKDGIVKGHYGYHDKHGVLRIIHYDAHPHEGFHAAEADLGHH